MEICPVSAEPIIVAISTAPASSSGLSRYAANGSTTNLNEAAPNERISAPDSPSPSVFARAVPSTIPTTSTAAARAKYCTLRSESVNPRDFMTTIG
ncbi:hypothetical protein D3C81_2087540 [compost metagenome]